MKLIIDEKLKHRLIGVAVIISLGAIFAPAMMKKSNQNMDNNYKVHVKLPPKPEEPNVALSDEKEVFKTIKIARVNIPDVSSESKLPELAKAEPIQPEEIASSELVPPAIQKKSDAMRLEAEQLALNKAAHETVKHVVHVSSAKSKSSTVSKSAVIASKATKPAKKPTIAVNKFRPKPQQRQQNIRVAKSVVRKPAVRTELYAVQLASFSQLSNAQSLVNRLRSKGYKANFTKVASRNGVAYKVYAGHSSRKMEVIKLKTQLASALQLNGFIVNTGVS
jgi:DedD protein